MAAFDSKRILTKITQEDLVAFVRDRGDTIENQRKYGNVSIAAKTESGLFYHLIGTICEQPGVTGCLGVEVQVRYDADSRVTLENINLANRTYSVAKVSYDKNEDDIDTVFVTHYVILDGGQNMGNLAIIITNALDVAPEVADIIWPN